MHITLKSYIATLAFSLINFLLVGQIPVGEWRDHLPYKKGKAVACSDEKIYCATERALFSYNKSDGYIEKMSKINILSDLDPGYIAFSKEHNKLIIGYLNGNIDIIENDEKYNFPDIKIKDIIADKNINHINIHNDFAYIATGFGIIVFNMEKNEFADSYIIGDGGSFMNINSTIIFDGYLFALTNNGVFRGDLNEPFLSNFQNWEKIDSLLNPNEKYLNAAVYNDSLILTNTFTNTDSTHIISWQNHQYNIISKTYRSVKYLTTDNSNLYILERNKVNVLNSSYEIVHELNLYANHLITDDDNLWIAETFSGLLHYNNFEYKKKIRPNGPESANAFKVFYNNGTMQVAPGGFRRTGAGSFYYADVYSFKDEQWSALSKYGENKTIIDSAIKRDVIGFTSLQSSNEYIAASYYHGIFKVTNNEITDVYNRNTTNGVLGDTIGGLTYDQNGNLYIVSNYSEKPFVVRTPDNKWYSYELHPSWKDLVYNSSVKLINTRNNDKWTISNRGKGILVFNDNGQPEIETNNYKKFDLRNINNAIIDQGLNDIVQDIEGTIWIATTNGVAVYDYPENALRDGYDFYARRPEIVVDGYLHDLLDGENVKCIAIDGANRKWFGTESGGLFLVSPDGSEQIMSWNTENSKLLSNNIYSIDINHKTGEVFIATEKGMQSYKSTSSQNKANYSEIYAFPNPVKGNYSGLITIRGLMYETQVKITDLSGNKVYETISNGGDAIWNGMDLSGNSVAPGIYLVMCTLPDGSETEATKILIIK